jgi:hypothetical protein
MSEENVEWVRRVADTWGKGDTKAVEALFEGRLAPTWTPISSRWGACAMPAGGHGSMASKLDRERRVDRAGRPVVRETRRSRGDEVSSWLPPGRASRSPLTSGAACIYSAAPVRTMQLEGAEGAAGPPLRVDERRLSASR